MIVWEDADLEWATQRIAASAYGYAGQVCISAQHVVASAGVLDRLRAALTEATLSCKIGSPLDRDTVCGQRSLRSRPRGSKPGSRRPSRAARTFWQAAFATARGTRPP